MFEQEISWAQRAYQNWITLGDNNTKFFQNYSNNQKKEKLYLKNNG